MNFLKRLLFVFIASIAFSFLMTTIIPWCFIGSILFFFRWLFFGKTNGVDVYILGSIHFAIILCCIFDDYLFDNYSFTKSVKHWWIYVKDGYKETL